MLWRGSQHGNKIEVNLIYFWQEASCMTTCSLVAKTSKWFFENAACKILSWKFWSKQIEKFFFTKFLALYSNLENGFFKAFIQSMKLILTIINKQ